MRRRPFLSILLFSIALISGVQSAPAKVRVSKLAHKMLYGSKSTKLKAISQFNKLPSSEQFDLVPDFKVALSDKNPEVRKIAKRILIAMGVKPPETSAAPAPPTKAESAPGAEPSTATNDPWADLKKMRHDEQSQYPDMSQELANEKKSQITLDATDLLKQTNQ